MGFAAVFAQEGTRLGNLSLIYGAYFLAVCLATHIFLRIRLPNADPYLFPLVALLTAFGLVMVYRIDDSLARDQANWFVLGLVLFALTIQFLRDYEVLERYRYTIAAVGLLLLLAPRLPGIGQQVNGAYLGVKIGPIAFQPAEFSKIAIVIFLASYLRENREVLIVGARRVLGVTLPPLKHFGPMLVVWGASMFMLVFIRDLGSSLMFFAAFLALLYVATGRFSFVVIGMAMFLRRRLVLRLDRAARPRPGRDLARPLQRPDRQRVPDPPVDLRPGRRRALRQGVRAVADHDPRAPTAIAAAGGPDRHDLLADRQRARPLRRLRGRSLIYLLIAARGFKIALLADDGFSKLLATGLTAVFAIQAFVIIGGVTRVIPLTGVTLPFISYGGSSIVANFVLLALLLLISDRARREATEPSGRDRALGTIVNRQIIKLFAFIVVLFAVLVGFTSYWSVFDAKALKEEEANKRPLLRAAADPPRPHPRRRRHRDRQVGREGQGRLAALRPPLPEGALFGHPIGYSFVRYGESEFEQFHNDELIGEESEFSSILDELTGTQAGRQRHRHQPRRGRAADGAGRPRRTRGFGAVVAIEPSTGAVKVMASNPPFDPNRVPYEIEEADRRQGRDAAAQPRHPGPLPAGLDLQGGDRRGWAGERRDHAGDDDRSAGHARSRRARRCRTTSTRTSERSPSTRR